MPVRFEGKTLGPVLRKSSEVREFPLDGAFELMQGRISTPEEAFGVRPKYRPLFTSEAVLVRRQEAGFDLVYETGKDQKGAPLTMRRMHEIFQKRHGKEKGALLYNFPNEPFLNEETPMDGWGFKKAIEAHSAGKTYFEQIRSLIQNAEGDASPALAKTMKRFNSEEGRLTKLVSKNHEEFLESLLRTGIETHLVPSAVSQLFHQAAVLAERNERPLRNVHARNSSRSREFFGCVAILGRLGLGGSGASVVGWDPEEHSSDLGVSSSRSIES